MRNIEKIQEKIISEVKRPVRLPGLLKKRKESLDEFLTKFFTDWNKEKDTIYADSKGKKTPEVQTPANKRRSVGDIYQIVKYYYPKATLEEVVTFLYKEGKHQVPRLRSSFCHTINKRVFYQGDENQSAEIHDHSVKDEHQMDVEQWRRQIKKPKES